MVPFWRSHGVTELAMGKFSCHSSVLSFGTDFLPDIGKGFLGYVPMSFRMHTESRIAVLVGHSAHANKPCLSIGPTTPGRAQG